MDSQWKRRIAGFLSCASFLLSAAFLAGFFYAAGAPAGSSWTNVLTMNFLGWILLLSLSSGIVAMALIIACHLVDMEVYLTFALLGFMLSLLGGIPFGIGYSIAHTPIG
jgi:hypothetical protein